MQNAERCALHAIVYNVTLCNVLPSECSANTL